jgi:hypothetical protein
MAENPAPPGQSDATPMAAGTPAEKPPGPPALFTPPSTATPAPAPNVASSATPAPAATPAIGATAAPVAEASTTPRASVTLTKPIQVQLAYGRITLAPGTALKFMGQEGQLVKVSYMNSVLSVPVTSTDLTP